jgi:predicted 2-oxoglutarate/Fe(II)-dependent dioxygenase YbiX
MRQYRQYNEIWFQISGYRNYYVSTFGRVKNTETEIILQQLTDSNGYCVVGLHKENELKLYRVHRLVANEFLEYRKNKRFVRHIDGNITNNCVTNLRWTRKNKVQHH